MLRDACSETACDPFQKFLSFFTLSTSGCCSRTQIARPLIPRAPQSSPRSRNSLVSSWIDKGARRSSRCRSCGEAVGELSLCALGNNGRVSSEETAALAPIQTAVCFIKRVPVIFMPPDSSSPSAAQQTPRPMETSSKAMNESSASTSVTSNAAINRQQPQPKRHAHAQNGQGHRRARQIHRKIVNRSTKPKNVSGRTTSSLGARPQKRLGRFFAFRHL
jgi:hypothetical protein